MKVEGYFDEVSMYEAIIGDWEIVDSVLQVVVKEGVYLDDHPLRDKYGEELPECILGFSNVSFSKRVIYSEDVPKGYVEYDELITTEDRISSLDKLEIGEFMDSKNTYLIEGHVEDTGKQIIWFISADGFYIDVDKGVKSCIAT